MLISLRSIFVTNAMLKIISFILGFSLWFIISRSYTTTHSMYVPVAIYAAQAEYEINAPENIYITLSGKRGDIAALVASELSVHIDGSQLKVGKNPLIISSATLFLPEHIKLLNYSPVPSIITLTQREQKISTPMKSAERPANATI